MLNTKMLEDVTLLKKKIMNEEIIFKWDRKWDKTYIESVFEKMSS